MRVQVKTVCNAVVEETWVFEVPDGTDPEEVFDRYSAEAAHVVSVEDDVYDERDREVIKVEVLD